MLGSSSTCRAVSSSGLKSLCWLCDLPYGEQYPMQLPVWKCKKCKRYICLRHGRESVSTDRQAEAREVVMDETFMCIRVICPCLWMEYKTVEEERKTNVVCKFTTQRWLKQLMFLTHLVKTVQHMNSMYRAYPTRSWISDKRSFYFMKTNEMVFKRIILPFIQMRYRNKLGPRFWKKFLYLTRALQQYGLESLVESAAVSRHVFLMVYGRIPGISFRIRPEWRTKLIQKTELMKSLSQLAAVHDRNGTSMVNHLD